MNVFDIFAFYCEEYNLAAFHDYVCVCGAFCPMIFVLDQSHVISTSSTTAVWMADASSMEASLAAAAAAAVPLVGDNQINTAYLNYLLSGMGQMDEGWVGTAAMNPAINVSQLLDLQNVTPNPAVEL